MGRFDGKTEKATPRKRREARSEGQVARSQEVPVAVSLLVAFVAFRLVAPASFRVIGDRSAALFAGATGDTLPIPLIREAVLTIGIVGVAPFLLVAVIAGVGAGAAQVGLQVTPKAAKPKWSKISPKQGLERLRPSVAGWELVRSGLKLGLLALVVIGPIGDFIDSLDRARPMGEALEHTVAAVFTILIRALLLALIIAGADYAVNRYRHEKQLKMSKEDIKQEHKNSEGDPLLKNARRRRAAELSRNRMLLEVGRADVVLTNPTHLAIALKYEDGMPAPKVLAKGADKLAAKIRREAYRHGIPVIEDKPLARALYRKVKVGGYIPGALYEAVAVVLATVYRRRGHLRKAVA